MVKGESNGKDSDTMVEKSVTVLKLKIAEANVSQLKAIAERCRTATNHGVEDWLLRQRGKKPSSKQREGLSESTKVYHAITAGCPDLHSQVASDLAGQINSNLSARLDWRRGVNDVADDTKERKRKRRRDAILAYEDRPPFTSVLQIPIHNRYYKLECGDQFRVVVGGLIRGMERMSLDLSTKQITAGIKMILHEMQVGARRMPCAKILCRGNDWYFYMPVMFTTEIVSDRQAILWPWLNKEGAHKGERPFRLQLPDRKWDVGDGRYLLAQEAKYVALRKEIGWRFRNGSAGGHGRAKYDKATSARWRQIRNIRGEVRKKIIRDVINQCKRDAVGVVLYREPTEPLRDKCWFAANGLDLDWTRLASDLKNSCAKAGIKVLIERLKFSEAFPKPRSPRRKK